LLASASLEINLGGKLRKLVLNNKEQDEKGNILEKN